MSLRVVALLPHPEESAGPRYRVLQYRDALAERGIELEARAFFTPEEFRGLYTPGVVRKAGNTLRGFRRRRAQLADLSDADVVLVYRELAPFFGRRFMPALRRAGRPWLYDFDDAVYLPAKGGSRWIRWLRSEREDVEALVRGAARVLAGNRWLADFAEGAGGRTVLLPTTVDTEAFRPLEREPSGTVRLSWVGSHTTQPFLEALAPALDRVAAVRDIELEVVSNRPPERLGSVPVVGNRWTLAEEPEFFRRADIGLYPLPDTPWELGKCGLKAVQYMACGVPVVAAPIGVVGDMVEHGVTGFHARSTDEWVDGIERLLRDPELRARMGSAGRASVLERYSLEAGADVLARVIREVAAP